MKWYLLAHKFELPMDKFELPMDKLEHSIHRLCAAMDTLTVVCRESVPLLQKLNEDLESSFDKCKRIPNKNIAPPEIDHVINGYNPDDIEKSNRKEK